MDSLRIGLLMSEDFLKALDQFCPCRPPNPADTDREIWMKAGERRLVEVLQAKFQQATQEGIL
jgi:hypothetical protein